MTTKISNYQSSLALSKNFVPQGIASGVVSYGPGVVSGDGVVAEIAGGTIAITGYPYQVYIDTSTATIVQGLQSLSPLDSIILFRGNNSSDLEDVRSWTASEGALTTAPPMFGELLNSYGPEHHWVMDTIVGGDYLDTGVATTASPASAVDETTISTDHHGPTVNETMSWVGAASADIDLDNIPLMLSSGNTTGSIVAMWKKGQLAINANRSILSFSGTDAAEQFNIRIDSVTDEVVAIFNDGGDHVRLTSSIVPVDGDYHWLCLTQDGTGMALWIDGVEDTGAIQDIINVSSSFDSTTWFDTWPPNLVATTLKLGIDRNHTSEMRGHIGNIAMFDEIVLSQTQIEALDSTLTPSFEEELLALNPTAWLMLDTGVPIASQVIDNAGAEAASFDPLWSVVPIAELLESPHYTGDRGPVTMVCGRDEIRDAAGGLNSGAAVSGFGSVIWTMMMGSDGEYIWSQYAGVNTDEITMKTMKRQGDDGTIYGLQYFNSNAAGSGAPDYQQEYDNIQINDGLYHLFYLIKNDDTNGPDLYMDNVLLTPSGTVTGGTSDPDRWFDDFSELFVIAARGNPTGNGDGCGMLITDFSYIEGTVLSTAQRTDLYNSFNDNRGTNYALAKYGLGAAQYWDWNESSGSFVTEGFGGRPTGSVAAGQLYDMDTNRISITTNAIGTGPIPELRSIDTTITGFIRSQTGVGGHTATTNGAAMATFKADVGEDGMLIATGGTGGGDVHNLQLFADGNIRMRLRNSVPSSTYDVRYTPQGGIDLQDNEWHTVVWSSDGTNWFLNIDGTWYDNGSTGWNVDTALNFDETDWLSALNPIDNITIGAGASTSGDTFGDMTHGPCATWYDYQPTTTQLLQYMTAIGTNRT